MAMRIEDYAFLGDGETAALVGRGPSTGCACRASTPAPASRRRSARHITALAFVTFLAARHMAAFQPGYTKSFMDPFFADGTERVLTSDVSRAWPVLAVREETWRPRGMLWGFTGTWSLWLSVAIGVWADDRARGRVRDHHGTYDEIVSWIARAKARELHRRRHLRAPP